MLEYPIIKVEKKVEKVEVKRVEKKEDIDEDLRKKFKDWEPFLSVFDLKA